VRSAWALPAVGNGARLSRFRPVTMTKPDFWVGSYARAGGRGLYPLTVGRDGGLIMGEPEPGLANVSFALWHERLPVAWFVDEAGGGISAWRLGLRGWEQVGSVMRTGVQPCYLARYGPGELLAVANYGDGSIELIATDPLTGALGGSRGRAAPSGSGSHPDRQRGPHAHCVVFDQNDGALFHVDLGLDRVFRYPVNRGELGHGHVVFECPARWGARHLRFLGDGIYALLVCEMAAQCILLEWRGTNFVAHGTVALAPPSRGVTALGGHLEIIGPDTALVSTRGHNSVAVLAVAQGGLVRLAVAASGGISPRHVCVANSQMIVAHEESGGVTAMSLPGAASAIERAAVPGAAFILPSRRIIRE